MPWEAWMEQRWTHNSVLVHGVFLLLVVVL